VREGCGGVGLDGMSISLLYALPSLLPRVLRYRTSPPPALSIPPREFYVMVSYWIVDH